MTEPFSITELLQGTGGRAVDVSAEGDVLGRIVTDSRQVAPGDVFWALVGDRHDGHDFLSEAVTRGAALCVVAADRSGGFRGPRIVVANTSAALLALAGWHRARCRSAVVGVTGSVGKTTTREAVHAVLSDAFRGLRSPRNYNNAVGVPLTLLSASRDLDYLVVELAASHVGEIDELCGFVRPDIGIVTAVAPAHLDGFGSIDGVLKAKSELPESLPPRGLAVLNGDDARVLTMRHRTRARVTTFGASRDCDVRGEVLEVGCEHFRFRVDGHVYTMRATGRQHLVAGLAAVTVGREFGMTPAAIAAGLERFTSVEGRSKAERIGDWIVVDDGYNASPASTGAAIETLREWDGAMTRVLVLGDMAELGDEAARFHEDVGTAVAEAGIEQLLAHGKLAERVVHGARLAGMDAHRSAVCGDFESLLAELRSRLEPGAVVLVKGSRSTRMERVVERMRRWSENERTNEFEQAAPVPLSA